MSTDDVTRALRRWMLMMGVPDRLTMDGGPQFKGHEFKAFCDGWRITHDPSSPYHHIANGHVEATVKMNDGSASQEGVPERRCLGEQ